MRKAIEFLFPYIADKKRWPTRPDIMYFEQWPSANRPCCSAASPMAAKTTSIFGKRCLRVRKWPKSSATTLFANRPYGPNYENA